MTITARRLNRATLARQLLLERQPLDVPDAVQRVVALQAQQPASPYIALWNRIKGLDPNALDAAFADRRIVKATLMRFTLHVVYQDDYPPMHEALQPSLRSWLGHRYFTQSGLSPDDAEAVLPDLLSYTSTPRTNTEVEAWLGERLGIDAKGVWWALRTFGPFRHAPTGGPWSFGQRPAYVATTTSANPYSREASDEALRTVALRYLQGFGPASVADLAQFAIVQQTRVRAALRALGDSVQMLEGPDGAELYDVPGGLRPAEDTAAPPRLMAMWDSALLAYADRSRIIPDKHRKHVIRSNGDVLPTLLVDGYVAGVWRPVEGGVEAMAFQELPDEAWQGLADEARALTAFLAERDPGAYRRYDHWWAKLPDAEVRMLLP